MRLFITCFGFAFLAATAARGDLMNPKLDAKDAIVQISSLETKGGFSAQFWVTTDDQIFSTWARAGAIRDLRPSVKIKRNVPAYMAVFLANPGVRTVVKPNGKTRSFSDVTFDLYIISPGGVLSLANKQRVGWRGAPPSPGLVYLAKDKATLNFEAIDVTGEYTIVVLIHDNVRKVDLKLSRKLDLVD